MPAGSVAATRLFSTSVVIAARVHCSLYSWRCSRQWAWALSQVASSSKCAYSVTVERFRQPTLGAMVGESVGEAVGARVMQPAHVKLQFSRKKSPSSPGYVHMRSAWSGWPGPASTLWVPSGNPRTASGRVQARVPATSSSAAHGSRGGLGWAVAVTQPEQVTRHCR